MFEEMNEADFFRKFRSEEKCKEFLYSLKWENGFCCKRCGNKKFWKGRTRYHTRCTGCGYDESLTANTIFHKIHLPLVKAFTIVYHLSVYKKGISCFNLSSIVGVSLKSVWFLKRKLQDSMGQMISEEVKDTGQVRTGIIDGVILTHRPKVFNGLQRINITVRSAAGPRKNQAQKHCTRVDGPAFFDPCKLQSGKYIDEQKDILHWNFRSWLTGVHHHCSSKYLKGYLDEFYFRYNHRHEGLKIWYLLMQRIIESKPYNPTVNAAKG